MAKVRACAIRRTARRDERRSRSTYRSRLALRSDLPVRRQTVRCGTQDIQHKLADEGCSGPNAADHENIRGVIIDGGKLRQCPGDGIVAFCLFPVEAGDDRWIDYLKR